MRKLLVGIVIALGALVLSTGAYAEGGGSGDGTLYVPSEYPTIQAAINNADDFDIIIVEAGLYDENLDISVKVSIEGAGSGTDSLVDTIIDPSAGTNGMFIHQPVNLKDLRVTGAPSNGIRVEKATTARLDFANVVWENIAIAANGGRGVEIHNGTDVSNMTITNCEIVDNTSQGIRSASDVTIDGLYITVCNIDRNQYAGLYLQGSVKNVEILGTTIDDNLYYGIYASETGPIDNLLIQDSHFSGNGYWAVDLWTISAGGIHNVTLSGVIIENNGIGVTIGAPSEEVRNVLIECSSVVNNDDYAGYYGIEHYQGIANSFVVRDTNIYNNGDNEGINVNSPDATGTVDAIDNWWGDASGPGGVGPGSGDAVTANVDFDPWLTNPANCEIQQVNIDIKPGSDPNSINCNNAKGVIAVAILTTEDFDATTVDHTTVIFEGASEAHVDKKTGEPRRHEEDVDGDGDIDLVFHFRNGDTDLACDSTEGTLTGALFDGSSIEGTDAVRMVD